MLSDNEVGVFLTLFNRGGYVLNFSTEQFDTFTANSIGVAICNKYQLSKGKSLFLYCNEADKQDVLKLMTDLLDYYECFYVNDESEKKYSNLYEKCKGYLNRENSQIVFTDAPAVSSVNREYISRMAVRAFEDISAGDYDSAITKARTLLEEVFCFAIEHRKVEPTKSGNIRELYTQVKTLYSMHPSHDADVRINGLLSGFEKILTSIAEMRNDSSDSHGVGARRIIIQEHHARLFVNSATTMSEYILSVVNLEI